LTLRALLEELADRGWRRATMLFGVVSGMKA